MRKIKMISGVQVVDFIWHPVDVYRAIESAMLKDPRPICLVVKPPRLYLDDINRMYDQAVQYATNQFGKTTEGQRKRLLDDAAAMEAENFIKMVGNILYRISRYPVEVRIDLPDDAGLEMISAYNANVLCIIMDDNPIPVNVYVRIGDDLIYGKERFGE